MRKLILTSTLLLASCATVFSEKEQSVTFDSNEKTVEIFVNNKKTCVTPCLIHVKRSKNDVLVVAKKEGFEDKQILLTSNVNPTSFFNALSSLTSTFGASTDLSSGKVWEYSPRAFYITMYKPAKNDAELYQRQEEEKLRLFVLKHFSDIKVDAEHEGSKEYIQTLNQMTKIPTDKINAMVLEATNEIALSNQLISIWHK